MICRIEDNPYHISLHGDRSSAEKPALLMLHGFMGSGKSFAHLAEALSEFCRPVTLDLLGHGRSGGGTDPDRYRAARQADDLHRLIRHLDLHPLYLHGYSMGARLALHFALSRGDRLRGLILESANPGLKTLEERSERRNTDEKRARAIEKNFGQFLEEWRNLPLFHPPDEADPGGEEIPPYRRRLVSYRAIQSAQRPRRMAASLRGFGTGRMPAVWDRLGELDLPTLILAGKGDRKYCELSSEINTMIPGSRMEMVPGAGHRVHLDQPRRFRNIVHTFITNRENHED